MSAPILDTTAIVLSKEPRDAFLLLHLLSPEHGKLLALFRLASKKLKAQPDLFDIADLQLQPPSTTQDSFFFVKEYRLHHRHTGIAKSYSCLEYASLFAKTVSLNPPLHDPHVIYHLAQTALASWEANKAAKATYLKSLFLLAQHLGYPIRQDWLKNLPSTQTHHANSTLFQPLAEINTPEPVLASLTESITHYLRYHTDILLPNIPQPA